MKRTKWLVVGCLVALAYGVAGCGGEAPVEASRSALLAGFYQTVPGHNKAQATAKYTCNGWTYRMLFSLEQHQDPASPTGWYAAIGPSSVADTGTQLDGVSADAYLQCYWGIIPADHGPIPQGGTWSGDLIATDLGIPCTLTTVWPASWHLPNPQVAVTLDAYHYAPSANNFDTPNGTIYVSLSSATAPAGGNGWCGGGWRGGVLYTQDKLPLPPPLVPRPLCSQSDYAPSCVVDPPCFGLSIADTLACLAPPPLPQ